VAGRVKIRRHNRIFGYARRLSSLISLALEFFTRFEADRFNHSRTLRWQKHASISHHPNGDGGKTSATAPRTVRQNPDWIST